MSLLRPEFSKSLTISIVITLTLLVALMLINQPLQTTEAPGGILSLELAGSTEHSNAILESWSPDAMVWAKLSIWLDFLFAPAYTLTLFLFTGYLSRDRPGVREKTITRSVKALFVIAGTCDIGENVFLLMNFSEPTDTITFVATLFALGKFTGLILGIAGLIVLRAARRPPMIHSH